MSDINVNISAENDEIQIGAINVPIAKGDKGDKGEQGEKGEQGIQGNPGTTDFNELQNKPTKLSDFENDSEFIDKSVNNLENYTKTNDLSSVATSGSYNDLLNKPSIPSKTSDLNNDSGFIDKSVNNLTNYTLKTATGSLIDLEINQSTYVVTLKLKDIDGNVISTDNIDLPLESVVVGGSYDATNKKIVLTLENGNTVDIPVGDLIAGLQTEITSKNKLASDLVDDSNSGNKFVNTSEKNSWNAKYDKPNGGIPKTDLASAVQTSLDKADTAVQDVSDKEDVSNKVTEIDETSTDTEYPSAKLLYDELAEKQEQIDGLVTENALLKDQIPNGTAEGTNVQITDSSNLPIEDGMLKGNTSQGGQPSPNPDYKQDIHTVTGDCEVEVVNKNWFDKDNANTINSYFNSSTTTLSSTSNKYRSIYIPCQSNTTYTVSKKISARFSVGYANAIPSVGDTINGVITNDNATSITITTGLEALYLIAFVYHASYDTLTVQEILDSIQIEKSSTATAYTPHAHQTFPISLGTIELCKIGDYQDYLFKNTRTLRSGRANPLFNADLDEGDWYKYSAIGKVVLDGSENWLKSSNTNVDRFYLEDSSFNMITRSSGYSNYFIIKTVSTEEVGVIYTNINQVVVNYSNYNITSLSNFMTWLSTHNLIFYYVLSTPTYIKITDTTLIAQLEAYYNSSTYRNITNIITAGEDLPPIASIVYKKDLTTLFNKLDSLEARVDLLE